MRGEHTCGLGRQSPRLATRAPSPPAGRDYRPGQKELGTTIKELSPEELLALVNQRREELEANGEIDRVNDEQPDEPPPSGA